MNIETYNDLSQLDWDFKKGRPCCVGFLSGSEAVIFISDNIDDEEFNDKVKKYIAKIEPKLYAFVSEQEQEIIRHYFFLKHIIISEIKAFKGKYWTKDKFLSELLKSSQIANIVLNEPFKEGIYEIPSRWEDYIKSKNKDSLKDISRTVLNVLIKESVLLNNKQYFLDNYPINENGWLVGVGKKKKIYNGVVNTIKHIDNNTEVMVRIPDIDKEIKLISYFFKEDGKKVYKEGSNWERYKLYYHKHPELTDEVEVEYNPNTKTYHVLL